MSNLAGLVVAVTVLGAAAPVPATPLTQADALAPPEGRQQLSSTPEDRAGNPFGGLFEPPALPGSMETASREGRTSVRPRLPPFVTAGGDRIVLDEHSTVMQAMPTTKAPCGIRVVPADPSVDPRMPRAFADPAVHHTTRVVPVPECEP